jgi:hypothetical protein
VDWILLLQHSALDLERGSWMSLQADLFDIRCTPTQTVEEIDLLFGEIDDCHCRTNHSRCSHAIRTDLLLLNGASGAESSALECFWFLIMALETVFIAAFICDLSRGVLPRLHHPSL